MKEKLEKDKKTAEGNKRLILTTAILLLAAAIIYLISIALGGAFHDFCAGAIWWVEIAIALASFAAYSSQES